MSMRCLLAAGSSAHAEIFRLLADVAGHTVAAGPLGAIDELMRGAEPLHPPRSLPGPTGITRTM